MNILKTSEKVKPSKIIFVIVTTAVAILIVSFTVGREWYEGKSQSLFSFGLIHFSGYLFFLLMPVEMAFIYYLAYFKDVELVGVALVTAVLAQIVDYLIGLSLSSKIINKLVGEKRIVKAEKDIHRYGNLTIFIFNLFPLSSPIIALVAGMLRMKFRELMFFSVAGLFLKYLILSLVF